MSKTIAKLKALPDDKTVVFWTPYEGEDTIVRTGIVSNGNCFLHAILRAYSSEYISSDKNGRQKLAKRIYASIVGEITKENWEEIGNGLISFVPFKKNFIYLLTKFYDFIDNDNRESMQLKDNIRIIINNLIGENGKRIELFRLITELIPLSDKFFEDIMPNVRDGGNIKISTCFDSIVENAVEKLRDTEEMKSIPKSKCDYICDVTRKFLLEILKESESITYHNYIKRLENISLDIDSYMVGLISDRINRDIYIIDSKTRLVNNELMSVNNLKGRKSIIILSIKNHYEIVGKLLPGNRIQREFANSDILINKINTFFVNPSLIVKKYPELSVYLPEKYDSSEESEVSKSSKSDTESVSKSPDNDF